MTRFALPLFFVLLAGCARSEQAQYTQFDNNASLTVNASLVDTDDDEVAIGAWRMGLQDTQSVLEFGPAGAAPAFSIGCDGRRNLLLQRHGAAPPGDLPVMLITVGSETRRLAVVGTGGVIPMLRSTLPGNDTFRGVLIAAGTPITVRVGDSDPLVLPTSPTIGAYAAQCANGEVRAPEAAANGVAAAAAGDGDAVAVNVVAGNAQ
ncbi:MAG: hypothetical protein QOD42_2996 [Sphingomonadales bacterium]|jgi:hypothetical protein|nr:hypothetical protein [Sphingomonadales bacterium]